MVWCKLEHHHGFESCLIFEDGSPGVVVSLVVVSCSLNADSLCFSFNLGRRNQPLVAGHGCDVGLDVVGVEVGCLVALCFRCHFSVMLIL